MTGLLYYIAPVIGVVTLVIGILAVLRPKPMSKNFGIAVDGEALPYVIATGIRDVFMGLTILVLFYLQEWVALGAINICIGIVAISDFWSVQRHGDKKISVVHLLGATTVIIYGVILII